MGLGPRAVRWPSAIFGARKLAGRALFYVGKFRSHIELLYCSPQPPVRTVGVIPKPMTVCSVRRHLMRAGEPSG